MVFSVEAIDGGGARRSFRREAPDAAALRAALKKDGMVVLSLSRSGGGADAPAGGPRQAKGPLFVSSLAVETGLRQLAAMLRSGVALLAALDVVAGQSEGKAAGRMWRLVASRVEKGESFSAALAAQAAGRFGDATVRLAEVGERTGELAHALSRAADQMEARRSLRSMVVNALAYPLLAVAMAVAVSAYLVAVVIPKLADFLRTGGVALPGPTRMLMDFSDAARANAFAICAVVAAAVAVWVALRFFDAAREIQDAALLRLPVVGRILRLSGSAVFSRSMQIMTEAGVALVDALETSAKLLANRRLRRRVDAAVEAVVRGQTLDAALSPAVEFMPMMRRMAAVGEVAGSLPDAFAETARFHETLLALAVKRFGMLIEPVMICVTGAIVGFVYIAFFVALFAVAGTR